MGQPKALVRTPAGDTFLAHLARCFEQAGARVLYVAGAEAAAVQAAHPGLECVENLSWESGQWSSVRAGLGAALALGPERVLVQPVDAPLVQATTVRRVLEALTRAGCVVATFRGAPGHPVGLTSPAARAVLDDTASRSLAEALARLEPVALDTDDAGVGGNINSPADYARAFGQPQPGSG